MKRTMNQLVAVIATAAVLTGPGLLGSSARADESPGSHAGHTGKPPAASRQTESAEVELLDLELLDQDGRSVRFKQDVIGDRLVALYTFYTTCGLICPPLAAIFLNLQKRLGSRLGQDVVLVSITVDPVTDIPARLKDYAVRHGAKPGWIFLTGSKPTVDDVLRGLGVYAADFTDHPNMILVGDGRHGGWTRFYDFPAPQRLLDRLDELRASRLARAE